MYKSLTRAVTVLLSVNVLAGCVTGGQPDDSSTNEEPPIGQLLNVTDLRTFVLPLDPYRMMRTNLSASTRAEHLLIQRCLDRFGFDYQIPPPPNPAVIGWERRYGLSDERLAAAWGYHLPPEPPDDSQYVEPSGEMKAVLLGKGRSTYAGQQVPEGGCMAEARAKLAEGAPRPVNARLGNELALESFNRTRADSRVLNAYDDWSACMKSAGYDYANPQKANSDPVFEGETASPEEINVAVADVRCKKESNLINIMATVETAYQKRALERNTQDLAVIKESIDIRERNAAAVLVGD